MLDIASLIDLLASPKKLLSLPIINLMVMLWARH